MKKKIVLVSIITIGAIVFLAGCTGTTQNKSNANTNTNSNSPPPVTGTEVVIPISDISTTATFYPYDSNGVTIRYFAVKDKQGTVHVAFDACDVCYQAKKGYKQVGDVMQCLNCGRQFAVTSIGTENTNGGCWPSYLPMTVNGSAVTIKIADLVDKQFMFE
jgi:uncharacterized membrane protein